MRALLGTTLAPSAFTSATISASLVTTTTARAVGSRRTSSRITSSAITPSGDQTTRTSRRRLVWAPTTVAPSNTTVRSDPNRRAQVLDRVEQLVRCASSVSSARRAWRRCSRRRARPHPTEGGTRRPRRTRRSRRRAAGAVGGLGPGSGIGRLGSATALRVDQRVRASLGRPRRPLPGRPRQRPRSRRTAPVDSAATASASTPTGVQRRIESLSPPLRDRGRGEPRCAGRRARRAARPTSSSALTTSARSPSSVGSQRVDRRIARGDVGPQSHGHLLGGAAALLLAAQRRAQVGVGSSIGHLGHELLDLRLPPVGPLQPQDADRVDQLGQRPGRDRRAERLVVVDGTSKPSERTRGNPRLARHGSHLARDRDRRLSSGDLVAHQDRVLDGTAQVAMLDRCRIGHVPRYSTDREQNECS